MKEDVFLKIMRYLDKLRDNTYPIDGDGKLSDELIEMIISLLMYPWEIIRRLIPFSGTIEVIKKVAYSDTKRFIVSYVKVGGKLYSFFIDDEISVGDHVSRNIWGTVFLIKGNISYPLKKGYRIIM